MRGKLVDIVVWVVGLRITPAGAGKTAASVCRAFCFQDHPRRCGENPQASTYPRRREGSPPQVRGKLPGYARESPPQGITPAGAGKTVVKFHDCLSERDHPRRCGENPILSGTRTFRSGSPPQVRGKPAFKTCPHWQSRITPAGAGKTRHTLHNTE